MKALRNTRRDFLKAMGLGAASLLVPKVLRAGPDGSRPNIVMVLADDLGYGDLSCYGASKIQTPNIDRLAREGRRFTDAHSPASVCTPSRYNLLTGRYAWRTWAMSSCVWANDPLLIEQDRFTLGDLLKQQGYRTACIGKWHLGFGRPGMACWDDVLGPDYNRELRPGPVEVGFDYFWGFPHVGQFPHIIIENDRVLGLSPDDPIRILPDRRPGYEKDYLHRPRLGQTAALGVKGGDSARYEHEELAVMLTKRAAGWLHEQTADQPFFLYLAHRNIHGPLRPNKRFKGKSRLGTYGDFILELDWSVGEVLRALDEKGLTGNTLVLFSSDNGGVVRYKPTDSASINGHKVNGPLRGQKTDAYEGGHRVPLIARWPGRIRPHTEDSSLIALTDMLATFADFFGLRLPDDAGEDSFSFLGALLGQRSRQVTRKAIVNDSYCGVFAIRQGDWKLVLSQHGGGAGSLPHDPDKPAGQLYHLGRDLAESVNEYNRHPEIVKSLSSLLEQYKRAGRSAPKYRATAAEK
ncbi:MAG: sulfatase family protein [Planctomycetota bacterium]|jgi:arylsulfatase A-like enzyme